MKDFTAFHILWNSNPFTQEATQLVCDCLNWCVRRSGKPIETAERALALYKLNMELKVTGSDRSE